MSKMFRHYIAIAILLCILTGAKCQETTAKPTTEIVGNEGIEEYNSNLPYCFQFTWLGPMYDNDTDIGNATCKDLIMEKKMKNTPCMQPLVITYDAMPPDIDYLWENHRERVLCKRSRGQSCVKYSYSFNDQLENVTYMCAKALTVGEDAVTTGCYSYLINGYEIRACMCQSDAGERKPCNTAPTYRMSLIVLLFVIILPPSCLKILNH